MAKHAREGLDFFPLTVDYEERQYAAGKIPGGYPRREGRPRDEAILMGRLTDRPIRPLFPKGLRNEVQVIITTLSYDQENDPGVLGILGASCALHISDIPWAGPIGGVRMGYVDGNLVVNPTESERERSDLDLIIAATADAVMMVEAGAIVSRSRSCWMPSARPTRRSARSAACRRSSDRSVARRSVSSPRRRSTLRWRAPSTRS
jgi:polyribonucleotide nucleotidyltransferase